MTIIVLKSKEKILVQENIHDILLDYPTDNGFIVMTEIHSNNTTNSKSIRTTLTITSTNCRAIRCDDIQELIELNQLEYTIV